MRWVDALFVLLVNAVPLYGIKMLGWSIGTVLLLFWFENLLVAVFTTARIVLYGWIKHARIRMLLSDYAPTAFAFTAVHGVIVAAIAFNSDDPQWRFSFDQFRYGALSILVFLCIDFIGGARRLGSRSFDWIDDYAKRTMGRVIILHVAILLGIWFMAGSDSPIGIFYIVIGLKTLWDLAVGAHLLQPRKTTPRWMMRLFDRIAGDAGKGASQELRAELQRAMAARGGAGKVDGRELMAEMLRASGARGGAPGGRENERAR